MIAKKNMVFVFLIGAVLVGWYLFGSVNNELQFRQSLDAESVYIPRGLLAMMNTRFNSATTEFVICIDGEINDEQIVFTSWTLQNVTTTNSTDVTFSGCPKGTIGTVHNHLNGNCFLSDVDTFTFGRLSGKDGHVVSGIICGVNDISFYKPNRLDMKLTNQYEV